MTTYLVAFLVAMAASWAGVRILRDLAVSRGWYDDPVEARKVHTRPIPRIGGVAIAIAFFIPLIGLFFWDNKISQYFLADEAKVVGLFGGAAAMVMLGLVDDLRGLSAKLKFGVQFAVAVAAYFLGFQIWFLANPFGDPIPLGMLSLPFTILWIVGITNAINLIDGLDGLAGGISLFAVLTMFTISLVFPNRIIALTTIALAGALIGFLRHNFNPATIFMGDSGSLFLGYTIAVSAVWGTAKSSTVVALLIPIVALGLPIMDTTLAVFRRFIRGKPLFSADREHIHHKLLDWGMSQREAVLVLYAGCIVLGLGALSLVYANAAQSAAVLGSIALATLVVTRLFGYLSWRNVTWSVRHGLLRRKRIEDQMAALREAGDRIRAAATVDEVGAALSWFASCGFLDTLSYRIHLRHAGRERSWEGSGGADDRAGPSLARVFPLDLAIGDLELSGELTIRLPVLTTGLDAPEELLYEWLAMLVRERVLELIEQQALRLTGTDATG